MKKPTKPIQQTRKKKKRQAKGDWRKRGSNVVFVNKKKEGFFLPTNKPRTIKIFLRIINESDSPPPIHMPSPVAKSN